MISGLRAIQSLTASFVIVFNATTLFEESSAYLPSNYSSIMYVVILLVLAMTSILIADTVGRKPLLIISLSGCAISLSCLVVYFYIKEVEKINMQAYSFLPLTALLLFAIMFGIGMSCIPVLITGEMFPSHVKRFVVCIMEMCSSIAVMLIAKFFHWSNNNFGYIFPFSLFLVCSFFGVFFIIFLVPETKRDFPIEFQKKQYGDTHPDVLPVS